MWGSFTCPWCHKMLRIRRNYPIRILRLALIGGALVYLLSQISDWFKLHIPASVLFSFGTISVIDEFVMRLLPAQIEPASGLIA